MSGIEYQLISAIAVSLPVHFLLQNGLDLSLSLQVILTAALLHPERTHHDEVELGGQEVAHQDPVEAQVDILFLPGVDLKGRLLVLVEISEALPVDVAVGLVLEQLLVVVEPLDRGSLLRE